jgi:hypothetical protein
VVPHFNIGDLVTYAKDDIMWTTTPYKFGVIVDKAYYTIDKMDFYDVEIYWSDGVRSWTITEGLVKVEVGSLIELKKIF